jgi:hypothetical protein
LVEHPADIGGVVGHGESLLCRSPVILPAIVKAVNAPS